ncbi:uncharacterized protein PSFLO_01265 [Pseudozyma flocculosa]|uniref:Uncharacterized protein n=1 Tax=Pseudozyma flocculosa TaxID=84751 RepID=A0A5C3ETW2_9BASI|nr:uncharacterized protein PSFLO_01265 [Pseudozyma flocculosa]
MDGSRKAGTRAAAPAQGTGDACGDEDEDERSGPPPRSRYGRLVRVCGGRGIAPGVRPCSERGAPVPSTAARTEARQRGAGERRTGRGDGRRRANEKTENGLQGRAAGSPPRHGRSRERCILGRGSCQRAEQQSPDRGRWSRRGQPRLRSKTLDCCRGWGRGRSTCGGGRRVNWHRAAASWHRHLVAVSRDTSSLSSTTSSLFLPAPPRVQRRRPPSAQRCDPTSRPARFAGAHPTGSRRLYLRHGPSSLLARYLDLRLAIHRNGRSRTEEVRPPSAAAVEVAADVRHGPVSTSPQSSVGPLARTLADGSDGTMRVRPHGYAEKRRYHGTVRLARERSKCAASPRDRSRVAASYERRQPPPGCWPQCKVAISADIPVVVRPGPTKHGRCELLPRSCAQQASKVVPVTTEPAPDLGRGLCLARCGRERPGPKFGLASVSCRCNGLVFAAGPLQLSEASRGEGVTGRHDLVGVAERTLVRSAPPVAAWQASLVSRDGLEDGSSHEPVHTTRRR